MPGHGHHEGDPFEGQPGFGGGWGVRRPLRFLAHKLDLDQKQVTELARILDELKIERAQAEVDDRRARAEFADAIVGATFDAARAAAAGERRVQSAARLRIISPAPISSTNASPTSTTTNTLCVLCRFRRARPPSASLANRAGPP